jgi:hypothetical protein
MAGVLTDAGMLQEAGDVLKGKSVTVRDCDLPTDGRRGMFIPCLSTRLVVCLRPRYIVFHLFPPWQKRFCGRKISCMYRNVGYIVKVNF